MRGSAKLCHIWGCVSAVDQPIISKDYANSSAEVL